MKHFWLIILSIIIVPTLFAQRVKIHSHNDYAQAAPLINALKHKAFIIEADVFVVDNQLMVAHHRNEIDSVKTLERMYIDPIVAMFATNKGSISADTGYTFNLMIDLKDSYEQVSPLLFATSKRHPAVFDRTINPRAVQVVISGNRGPVENWLKAPEMIMFDGRPNEQYNKAQLEKVAYISDSYFSHVKRAAPLNTTPLIPVAEKIHSSGKLARFWGGPDTPEAWKKLVEAGVDIINTDHVEKCRALYPYK